MTPERLQSLRLTLLSLLLGSLSDWSVMSRRLSIHVCLSCRHAGFHPTKQDAVEPLFRLLPTKRQISTAQSRRYADVSGNKPPADDNSLADANLNASPKSHDEDNVLPLNLTLHQARLHSPIDELRDRLLGGFRAYQRFDHLRTPELEWQKASPIDLGRIRPEEAHNHSHSRYPVWENVEEYKMRVFHQLKQKDMRKLMRDQLMRCRNPRDILQVVAVAMQRRETAVQIAQVHYSILSALYRTRNRVSDADVLSALNVIINRFRKENLPVRQEFILGGLRFAARSRSLPAMKRYLKDAKDHNIHISGRVFRSIIAKFSISCNGLGEIRNGRWKKKHLLQVLLGFEGMDPAEAYHLGAFLERNDWAYFHGWVAVLARCRAVDHLWKEWEWWRDSEERATNKQLLRSPRGFTVKTRGDAWLIGQLLYAGEYERAWQLMYETKTPLKFLSSLAKSMLMDHPEYAREWDEPLKQALMEKYEAELGKIERAFGIKWVAQGDDGFHVSYAQDEDAEEIIEKLADPSTRIPHGYPEE